MGNLLLRCEVFRSYHLARKLMPPNRRERTRPVLEPSRRWRLDGRLANDVAMGQLTAALSASVTAASRSNSSSVMGRCPSLRAFTAGLAAPAGRIEHEPH